MIQERLLSSFAVLVFCRMLFDSRSNEHSAWSLMLAFSTRKLTTALAALANALGCPLRVARVRS
jgi:hypothetical protein